MKLDYVIAGSKMLLLIPIVLSILLPTFWIGSMFGEGWAYFSMVLQCSLYGYLITRLN